MEQLQDYYKKLDNLLDEDKAFEVKKMLIDVYYDGRMAVLKEESEYRKISLKK